MEHFIIEIEQFTNEMEQLTDKSTNCQINRAIYLEEVEHLLENGINLPQKRANLPKKWAN